MTTPVELLAQLPNPTAHVAAVPRFDGGPLAVGLDVLSRLGAEAVRALYRELEPVEIPAQEGGRFFTLEGFREARAQVAAIDVASLPAPAARALHAITGVRMETLDYELPRWGRGRITQDLHKRVLFLAGQQRRLMRAAFAGLDDERVAEDRVAAPQEATALVSQWHRGTSDADPHGLSLEVAGSVEGPVASSVAELTAQQRAVQALLSGLHARAPQAPLTLGAERVEGVLRIAGVLPHLGTATDARAGDDAGALVAAAFGLASSAEAEKARLVGEHELEGGVVAWVCWPPLP